MLVITKQLADARDLRFLRALVNPKRNALRSIRGMQMLVAQALAQEVAHAHPRSVRVRMPVMFIPSMALSHKRLFIRK
jgi:hypothetical protein